MPPAGEGASSFAASSRAPPLLLVPAAAVDAVAPLEAAEAAAEAPPLPLPLPPPPRPPPSSLFLLACCCRRSCSGVGVAAFGTENSRSIACAGLKSGMRAMHESGSPREAREGRKARARGTEEEEEGREGRAAAAAAAAAASSSLSSLPSLFSPSPSPFFTGPHRLSPSPGTETRSTRSIRALFCGVRSDKS